MARKSAANDFVELVSWFPWWVGVVAAVISYVVFTGWSNEPLSITTNGVPRVNVLAVFGSVLRWLVPLLCVAGAVMSAIGRAHRKGLRAQAQVAPREAVQGLGWRDFEMLVGQAFRMKGYTVVELGGAGPDGGVDLLLRRGEEKVLVQCKHWKTYRVGLAVVREMLGAMTAQRATQGMVITSGRYTEEAKRFARENGIQLVDGDSLPELLGAAKAAKAAAEAGTAPKQAQAHDVGGTWAAPSPRAQARPAGTAAADDVGFPGRAVAPACPVCAKAMVERVARNGTNAGAAFWGCSGYPACKGTRPK